MSFHLGIDLVLMLMSETARNKHGSPAVTHQWLVCTPNISQFLLLGMVQMAGFHGLGERSRKPYRSSAASCLAQRKNKSSWYGYGSSLGTQYFDGFVEKHDPTGFCMLTLISAPTSRNNRSQLAWRQFTLCNDVCVICFSKLHGSFPSLPSLK